MIRTLLKHYIYETCLSICFDKIEKNLTDYSDLVPIIGDRFSRIIDNFTGDIFVDCAIIHFTDLGYYSDLDADEYKDIAFAIRFKKWIHSNGYVQSGMDGDGFDEIHFDNKNLITLTFKK